MEPLRAWRAPSWRTPAERRAAPRAVAAAPRHPQATEAGGDEEDCVARSVAGQDERLGWDSQIVLGALRLYRQFISPLLPPNCRYAPSCSRYGIEAVKRYGALQGGVLLIWRLIRCTPLVPIDRSKLVLCGR
ncbi:unnamed protein product [Durusdinium trenchii]|uniref:Membrane protein insertion efficiency factor n=1 Tax=Durusdinium trenchii TaxID=1381693 RepID=A0ABP0IAM3_9DINO